MAIKPGYAIHFVADLSVAGVRFTRNPTPEHGIMRAEFADSDGAHVSLSG